jgi:hypothetical protein
MKKLFYIIMLLNISSIFMGSNNDLNKKAAYGILVGTIPCASPIYSIHEAWYTADRSRLYDIESKLAGTSLKSLTAAFVSAHLSCHLPHISKVILFLDAHAVGIVPGVLGMAFVRMKRDALDSHMK